MSYFLNDFSKDKFVVLYLFAMSGIELTNNQVTLAVLGNEWSDYFSLQQSLDFLCENDFLIRKNKIHGQCYGISETGRQAVVEFISRLPASLKNEIDEFIADNKDKWNLQSQNIATFEKINDKEYIVSCQIVEGKTVLLDMKLNVATRNIAADLTKKWKTNAQQAYSEVLRLLN